MGNWEEVVRNYNERMLQEEENGIKAEKDAYQEILSKLTMEEVDNFIDEGEIPKSMLSIIDIDVNSNNFISKTHKDAVIGNIDDILERKEYLENNPEEEE